MELFQGAEEETSTAVQAKVGGKVTAEANFFIAKGSGEISPEIGRVRETGKTFTRNLSSGVVALKGLRESKIPVVIDDFHYVPKDIQGQLIRALKPLIFEGLPVVVIAIPHRRYDAVKVEREMTGRISPVAIKPWSNAELRFIPETGFGLLNYTTNDALGNQLAHQSIGSPHLMQEFCRGICGKLSITATPELAPLEVGQDDIRFVFENVADTIGRPIFERLARGPRQRSDRVPRKLQDGRTVDIYELVLHGLAHIRPGLVSIEYEELRAAIREVSVTQIPQLHEIARVLKHMATIAATDTSSTPVLDFEEEDKKLHITDPFFAFYLRWGRLSAEGETQGELDY